MAAHSALSVLIIEDDFMVASVHRAFTERVGGFAVQAVAHTGHSALAYLEKHQPDLILLDVYLPDLSGLQVLAELRHRRIQSDVIFITAARDVEIVQEAARGGAVSYIVKPFGFAKFSAVLNEYARLRRSLRSARTMDQEAVDQFYATVSMISASAELPKGLSEMTLEQVVKLLRQSTAPVTAEEVALGVGITRSTARRYLEYLMRQGTTGRTARYGTVGRPEHRYTIVDPLDRSR